VRRKSQHFAAYRRVVREFAALIDLDPWLLDPEFAVCGEINFQERAGTECLAANVDKLLYHIRAKYQEYGIDSTPFVVVKADAPVQPGHAFAVALVRLGMQLMMEVNHEPVAVFNDPSPLPGLDGLGLDQGGSPIFADDIAVATPLVNDYTFETAPTDWSVRQGTWEITSRWSCTPGWAWFSGYNSSGYALISTKAGYTGDQDVVMYVAPKMMPTGGNRYSESFGDVYLGLCADGASSSSGYQVAFAGQSSSYTVLRRQGQITAQSPYRLPQSGEHNDWLRLMVRKRGPSISVWVWDAKILQYEDAKALNAGQIILGTRDNGIMVPRVTVYGRRA